MARRKILALFLVFVFALANTTVALASYTRTDYEDIVIEIFDEYGLLVDIVRIPMIQDNSENDDNQYISPLPLASMDRVETRFLRPGVTEVFLTRITILDRHLGVTYLNTSGNPGAIIVTISVGSGGTNLGSFELRPGHSSSIVQIPRWQNPFNVHARLAPGNNNSGNVSLRLFYSGT